ncbi:hypothetical protein ACQ4M4_18810 [Leptolyngbya sp. AN02str]|uniref:hypothetical protein n=1 Tax=Leptolyngbya sp. AN02str TaxID=3423363 RepID=UPI003D310E69
MAKRVAIAFRKSLAAHIVSTISVSQRGAVVVLRGGVPNSETLQLLVDVAMQVEGASGVEINGVTYFSPMDLRFATQRRVRSLAC